MPNSESVVVVELGSKAIRCACGNIREDDKGDKFDVIFEIVGTGVEESEGIEKGTVVDMSHCGYAVEGAICKLENSIGSKIKLVTAAGVSGDFLKGDYETGKIQILRDGNEIKPRDLLRLHNLIRTKKKDKEYEILHVLPLAYRINGKSEVKNPIGMVGNTLEMDSYVLKAQNIYVENLSKIFHTLDMELENGKFLFSSVGAAELLLKKDEKDLGSFLIDMGADTTKVLVYHRGKLIHFKVVPIGGNHLTTAVATFLHTDKKQAEDIIKEEVVATPESLTTTDREKEIFSRPLSESGELKSVTKEILSKHVETFFANLFSIINKEKAFLEKHSVYIVKSVLTGGASKVKYLDRLASKIVGIPCVVRGPKGIHGLGEWENDPEYSSVVGMLKLLALERKSLAYGKEKQHWFFKGMQKVLKWFYEAF